MKRILCSAIIALVLTATSFGQGIVQPASAAPRSLNQNTLVVIQPMQSFGYAGGTMWTRGPVIGTGVYANRPWISTPWVIPTGSNLTYTAPWLYGQPMATTLSYGQVYSPPVMMSPTPVYMPAARAGEPATFAIDFPLTDVQVTVNGVADPNTGTLRTFVSRNLAPGEKYTFDIKATWTKNGQAYEWEKSYRLAAGEKVNVSVVGGFPVTPAPAKK